MKVDELAALGGPKSVTSPLPKAWPRYDVETVNQVIELIHKGETYAFGGHPSLEALESWAMDYLDVPFALATGSGTAALASAFVGVGIGPGDEVLVPSYTFHASATPLFSLGAIPILVDCHPIDARIDIADLLTKLTSKSRAIVVTHMFGLPGDLSELVDIASRHGMALIEDAAQAHGSIYRGRPVGGWGDVGCFSLGGAKMISGGMGGLLVTKHREVFERALVLGHAHERASELIKTDSPLRGVAQTGWGGNLRMSPLNATLALEHARSLEGRIEQRTNILEGISVRLSAFSFLVVPTTPPDRTRGGWYGYKVGYRAQDLDELPLDAFITLLLAEGVKITRPTTLPLHMTMPFQSRNIGIAGYDPDGKRPIYTNDDLPVARDLWGSTLSFPDKHFHEEASVVLDEYAEAISKIENNIFSRGAAVICNAIEKVSTRSTK